MAVMQDVLKQQLSPHDSTQDVLKQQLSPHDSTI